MQSPFNEPVARSIAVFPKGSNMRKKLTIKLKKNQKYQFPTVGLIAARKPKLKAQELGAINGSKPLISCGRHEEI